MNGGDAGSAGEALRGLLPQQAQERVTALRLADGVASVVIDVVGLDQPARDRLEIFVKDALRSGPGVREVRVAMTADRTVESASKPRILAVASGKGGVGKSTLSANLAVALRRMGKKVGLVDADIYGPSQPRLLATEGQKPEARDSKMIPIASPWGVPMLSMGHLVEPGRALAWRGPMASNALGQLIDAHWGDVEVLIVDLPPGTGDVQLSMVQKHKPAGAVIVSTPQDLALIDAIRAIQLFEQTHIPVVGIVENMSGYVCPHCGETSDPFGHGGAEAVAKTGGEEFLGRVPLDLTIRQDSDAGKPPAAGEGPQAEAFAAIAQRVAAWLDNAG
jgi:ATP-binding protein involved in chromosome partitioning